MKKAFLMILASMFLFCNQAVAHDYGTNITIFDGMKAGGSSWWNTKNEDQEVEPNTLANQAWDLEAFFLDDNNILSLVGGFNFITGVPGYGYQSGDIFIDIDGDAEYGAGNTTPGHSDYVSPIIDTFGYDYVLDLDFSDPLNLEYHVYKLIDGVTIVFGFLEQNEESNPWRLAHPATAELLFSNLPFAFSSGLTDDFTGMLGGTHYAISGFDLSFLGNQENLIVHFTEGCGNDNLMGMGTTTAVPEPATMLLLGTGMLGLGGLVRRLRG